MVTCSKSVTEVTHSDKDSTNAVFQCGSEIFTFNKHFNEEVLFRILLIKVASTSSRICKKNHHKLKSFNLLTFGSILLYNEIIAVIE